MMKKTFVILVACLMGMGHAEASDVLTVADVTLPQNSETTIEIGCEFETEFLGYSLDIELGNGLTLVLDEDNKPVGENGFTGTDHSITSSQPAEGKYRFVVVSFGGKLLPMSGSLLKVRVTGADSKNIGDIVTGKITATEFTDKDKGVHNLADVSFNITIGEPADNRTILDETSTTAPEAATGVNVRVKRTINANEWSTICLPFAMTEEQVKAAFGDKVKLGDFQGCEENGENVNVKFIDATAIEANHPYVIKVSDPVSEFTVDGVDITLDDEPIISKDERKITKTIKVYNSFIGNYVNGTKVDDYGLYLMGGKFWYSKGNVNVKAFRGYFVFESAEVDYDAARLCISFGEATGITTNNVSRVMNDDTYSLSGQRISKAGKKGVYVKNGKKVIVK